MGTLQKFETFPFQPIVIRNTIASTTYTHLRSVYQNNKAKSTVKDEEVSFPLQSAIARRLEASSEGGRH